jgi:hypothetical protein
MMTSSAPCVGFAAAASACLFSIFSPAAEQNANKNGASLSHGLPCAAPRYPIQLSCRQPAAWATAAFSCKLQSSPHSMFMVYCYGVLWHIERTDLLA